MLVMRLKFLWLIVYLSNSTAFHQDDYEVTLDIVQLINYNHTYLRNFTIGREWYNRTTRVINAAAIVLKDLGMHLKFEVEHYTFLSNEYRFFPMSINGNLCTQIQSHNFGIRDILDKCTNLKPCPIKRGHYHGRNCFIDYTKFPPHVPRGRYKMAAMFYNGRDFIAEVHVFSTVKDKNKWIR